MYSLEGLNMGSLQVVAVGEEEVGMGEIGEGGIN